MPSAAAGSPCFRRSRSPISIPAPRADPGRASGQHGGPARAGSRTLPRFAQALEQAQVAELEPGDVLFYPALWWHNVEALAPSMR
ncbi:cupin-like domain-containing protein [Hankyongella ginsenosidimutans]|uniref:cupin-like domain-containing protein n=1 Tax=Hankyongella ginsenosidimutans TaxID=1763828 RepID=UPI00319E2D1E